MIGAKPRACEALRLARVLVAPGEASGRRSRARARELRSPQGKSLPSVAPLQESRSLLVGSSWSVLSSIGNRCRRWRRVVLDRYACRIRPAGGLSVAIAPWPNIALQPTSPASPSPRLSCGTLGGCELPSAPCLGEPASRSEGMAVITATAGTGLKSPRGGEEPLRAAKWREFGPGLQICAPRNIALQRTRSAPLREPLSFGTLARTMSSNRRRVI